MTIHFNNLIPELDVSNLEKSLQFYIDLLGFIIEYRREESAFVFLSLQGSQIMLQERNGNWETGTLEHPYGRGINFQIQINSIDLMLDNLFKNGCPLMKGPWESWYRRDDVFIGQQEFLVQDPDGYLLRFSEYLGVRNQKPDDI